MPFRIFKKGELALIPEGIRDNAVAEYGMMVCADTRLLEFSFEQVKNLSLVFNWSMIPMPGVIAAAVDYDFRKSWMISLGRKESIGRFYELYPELYGNSSFRFRDMYIARFLNMNPVTFCKLRRLLFPNYPDP